MCLPMAGRTEEQDPQAEQQAWHCLFPAAELGCPRSQGAPRDAGCRMPLCWGLHTDHQHPLAGGCPGRAARVPPALHGMAGPRDPRVHDFHYDLQRAGSGADPEHQGRGADPRALQVRLCSGGGRKG